MSLRNSQGEIFNTEAHGWIVKLDADTGSGEGYFIDSKDGIIIDRLQ